MPNSSRRRERETSNEDDEEARIEYGIRRSRRATSFEYRDSSSLSPAQIMEQEVYYTHAEDALAQSLYLAQVIALLLTPYHYFSSMMNNWQRHGNIASDVISDVQEKLCQIKERIETMLFLVRWIISYGELSLLYAEDITIFIRRRNRFQPPRFRRIEEINRQDCYIWFGLNPHDLMRLFWSWRCPDVLRTSDRHVFTGEECFIIFLFHMIKGTPFTEMARHTFGGDPRYLSNMFELMIDHLYMTFYNKISGTSLGQWIPRYLNRCRELIHGALSDGALHETEYVNGEVVNQTWIQHHFDIDTFRIFGFLDDFAIPTARPATEASRRHHFEHDIQRAFYSGYLRRHGLKAQVVYLPIGIVGSVYITELRQNDNGVQNMSGLNNYLLNLVRGIFFGGLLPCLYCDGIFRVLVTILPRFSNPTPDLHLLNVRLASLRECIEHIFADHRIRFRLFSVPHYLHLYNQGVKVRRMCLVSFFVLNCYYCIGGTRCRYFGQIPPALEDYLPLNEVLQPPPAVDLGEVWNYGPELN